MEDDVWEEMFDTYCRCIEGKIDITHSDHSCLMETIRWLIEKNPTVANNVYKENKYEFLKEALSC